MVVVPEPAVKCCCAFGAVAVDGAVGPAGEHGADEALGFAVGLRSVGPRAQVAQTEGAAGDGVQLGAITRAVVGHHALDGDAVAAVEGDGAAQESSDGGGLLVGKYFGVGQARGVVDGDVDVVPTGRLAAAPGGVGNRQLVVAAGARDALARAALDAPELLDVNVDQFAGPLALIALSGLETQASELAHPDPREDPRHRRQRHLEQLGELRPGEAQPPQRGDRLNPTLVGAIGDYSGRRRAIQQSRLALSAVTGDPLRSGVVADFGRLGGLRQRPPLLQHPANQAPALIETERRVSVQLHPVSSLGLLASTTSSLQGGPDELLHSTNNVLRNYT